MCQISWNAQSIDEKGRTVEPDEICVNPLTWENNNLLVGREKNFGSLSFMEDKEIIEAQQNMMNMMDESEMVPIIGPHDKGLLQVTRLMDQRV